MKTFRKPIVYCILSVFIAGLAIDRLQFIHHVAQTPSHSFVNYYTASRLLSQGEDVYKFYDDSWYSKQVLFTTPTISDIYQPHPPITSLLMLPLVQFGHDGARIIWIGFTLVMVIIAVGMILYLNRPSLLQIQLIILVLLTYQPLYANFEYAQVYGVLFAFLVIMLWAYQKKSAMWVGLCLGIMLTFKLVGYLIIPMLIIRQRWRALFAALAVIVSVVLLTLPWLGISSWIAFFEMLPEHNQRPSFAVTAYQSISSFFRHQFTYHETWNPSPLFDMPQLATVLSSSFLVMLLLYTFWRIHQTAKADLSFASLVLLTVMMSPASLDYHYAIVLLPVLVMIVHLPYLSSRSRLTVIAGIFLLSVDYPYQQAEYEQTFLSLMAYPKLIGALLLWLVAVSLMKKFPRFSQSSSSGA